MNIPGREFNSDKYRYGQNTQEKTPEVAANNYTAEFWQYDSRIGRRWNVDPRPSAFISSYATFGGNPIMMTDVLGDTIIINLFGKNDKPSFHAAAKAAAAGLKRQVNDGVFIVFAHANSDGLQYSDPKKSEPQFASTSTQISTVLNDNSNGEWNKALNNNSKTPVTLVVNACNFASNDFYDEHFNQGVIHRDMSAAQRVAKDLKVTVLAQDGYCLFNADPAKPGVIGLHNQDGDAGVLKINNKGVITSKKRIEFTKPTANALGKKRGLITGINNKQIIKKR